MSSSEEYLDSLLDSILSGGKSDEEEKSVSEESQGASVESRATDAASQLYFSLNGGIYILLYVH